MLVALASFLVRHFVFALMLSVGLAARPRDLLDSLRRPTLYLRLLLVLEVGVPLLAIAVASLFQIPREAKALILLMAICPGAPAVAYSTKQKGETYSPVGLCLLLFTSLLSPLLVPAWVWILGRVFPFELSIQPLQVLNQVLPTVTLPLFLGMGLRQLWPRAAELLAPWVHRAFLVSLTVAIAVVLYLGAPVLWNTKPLVILACWLMVVASEFLGYWAAKPAPEAQRTASMAAVLGNPGLALTIVAVSYPGLRASAFLAAYLLFRSLALLPFTLWLKRRSA